MNCHHARQLISPYLDHQLTGREMLALQDHFEVCLSCEREMRSIREVKALLRGLREPGLPRGFSQTVVHRLEREQAAQSGWRVVCLPMPKPQRGRRLATALALSCLTVVSFVAPFAPDGRDAAQTSSSFLGTDRHVFAAPAAPDMILSGSVLSDQVPSERLPDRIMLIPVNELSPISPAELSVPPRPDPLTLAGMGTQPSLEMNVRSQDISFGTAQFALARSRQ